MPRRWTEESVVDLIRGSFESIVAPGARGLIDDGAWLPELTKSTTRVVSCDAFQEGNDFLRTLSPLESAGHRVITQNLSDLAAMGARPVGFLWSLEVPSGWLNRHGEWLKRFCNGAAAACQEQGLLFYGGDLSFSADRFGCTVTILGDVRGQPLSRQGARPGDHLFVSRPLGLSAFGLELLLKKMRGRETVSLKRFSTFASKLTQNEQTAIQKHLWPKAEIELGQSLVGLASACMDISDGLARDLHRLCRASKVGAELTHLNAAFHDALPSLSARKYAAFGGEEYALLFTTPPQIKPKHPGIRIGTITDQEGIVLEQQGSRRVRLDARGYDHFTSRP